MGVSMLFCGMFETMKGIWRLRICLIVSILLIHFQQVTIEVSLYNNSGIYITAVDHHPRPTTKITAGTKVDPKMAVDGGNPRSK